MDPSHEIEFRDIKDKNLLDVMKVCLAICFDLQSYSLSMVLFSAIKLIVGNCHNVNCVSPLYSESDVYFRAESKGRSRFSSVHRRLVNR